MSYSFTDDAGDEQDGIERAEARAEERLREQRWNEFVLLTQQHYRESRLAWSRVIVAAGIACSILLDHTEGGGTHLRPYERACGEFADTEGWHGVLHAIGQAMQEEANARAKAEVVEGQKAVK